MRSATDRTQMVLRNYSSRYDQLIGKADGLEKYITRSGEVEETPRHMAAIVSSTLSQTAKLAPLLRGANLRETCYRVFSFVYTQVNYRADSPLREELRSPARTWADRIKGVDCDCYAIFISSILHNLGIPHAFRMTKYNGRRYYQHVYVIVPHPGGHYTIDPVLDAFDAEKPFSAKKDMPLPVAHLSGVDDDPQQVGNIFKKFYEWQKKPMNKVGNAIKKVAPAVSKLAPVLAVVPGVGPLVAAGAVAAGAAVNKVLTSKTGQAVQQALDAGKQVKQLLPSKPVAVASVVPMPAQQIQVPSAPIVTQDVQGNTVTITPITKPPGGVIDPIAPAPGNPDDGKIMGLDKKMVMIGGAAVAALLLLR